MELWKELKYHWYWLIIQIRYKQAMKRLDSEPIDYREPELRYTKRCRLNHWKETQEIELEQRIYGK